MTIIPRLMTADDLLRLPDDGLRRELIAGEVRAMSPARRRHGRVTMRLGSRLARYVEEQGLGEVLAAETGFQLASSPDTVRAPDVAFVRRERVLATPDDDGYWPGAPDLAVEVLSPSDRPAQVADKVAMWLAYGTHLVWVVDPVRRTVSVHHPGRPVVSLTEAETLAGDEVVPGWSLPLADLFR